MKKLLEKIYRKSAKVKMIHSKRQDLAVFGFLELYLKDRIVDGEVTRRGELAEMQKKIEETKRFISFIKAIK